MLDSLAERYGMLPSKILREADTMDVYVLDVVLSYQNHVHSKATSKPEERYDVQTLEKAIGKFKNR